MIDDSFMCKVFEDRKCAEFLLHIILDRDDLTVQEVKSQYEIKNLQGRSIRLDVLAKDDKGKYYNIEIQRSDKGAVAQRARYNSSLIDANITEPGEKYENLNENYVIFITENDVLKRNLPIYHAERVILETFEPLNDGSHIIYVNSQARDETKLGQLMRDFYCTDADDIKSPVLSERVRYFKEDEKGANNMCRAIEELCKKADYEATMRERIKIALSMWKYGIRDIEQIALMTELSTEDVKKALESIQE